PTWQHAKKCQNQDHDQYSSNHISLLLVMKGAASPDAAPGRATFGYRRSAGFLMVNTAHEKNRVERGELSALVEDAGDDRRWITSAKRDMASIRRPPPPERKMARVHGVDPRQPKR